jgi:uncharacterized membrane protein
MDWKKNKQIRQNKKNKQNSKSLKKEAKERTAHHELQVVMGHIDLPVAAVRSIVAVVSIPVAGAGFIIFERWPELSRDSITVELLVD